VFPDKGRRGLSIAFVTAGTHLMALTLSSPAFVDGGDIPQQFTCDGENISPHLVWTGALDGVQSFVLIMEDPDAPPGPFTHWLLFDIPSDRTDVPSGTRSDAVGLSGRNSRGTLGYMGPCPPSGMHRYLFRLFALDVQALGFAAGASRQQVDEAIAAHAVETMTLMGRYQRQPAIAPAIDPV
jgi:Raf kinase inhibitor-like YbhB/YbcL family protein